MKKVHDTRSVAALFAEGVQPDARNTGNTIYFKEGVLYSYRDSFPIAKHVKTRSGTAIMVTLATYSKTTAKHVSYARQACSGLDTFQVYDLDASKQEQFLGYASRLDGMLDAWKKARGNKSRIRQNMRELTAEANWFATSLGLSMRLFLPVELREADEAELREANAKRDAAEAAEKRNILGGSYVTEEFKPTCLVGDQAAPVS